MIWRALLAGAVAAVAAILGAPWWLAVLLGVVAAVFGWIVVLVFDE